MAEKNNNYILIGMPGSKEYDRSTSCQSPGL